MKDFIASVDPDICPRCTFGIYNEIMEKAIVAGTRAVGSSGARYDKFAAAYKAATGKNPGIYCDTTYDAVKMIAKAIEKAGVYDGEAIRDALFEIGQKYRGRSLDFGSGRIFDRNSPANYRPIDLDD